MPRSTVKVHCGFCGRRLLDLKGTAAGFRLQPRPGIRMDSVFEHDEARFLVNCWCPGERAPEEIRLNDSKLMAADRERFRQRTYVLTTRALLAAWEHAKTAGPQVVIAGDAVLAGKIR